jgi:hypothetical protein
MNTDEGSITPQLVAALSGKDEVTKQEAAVLLSFTDEPITTRSVERYVHDGKLQPVKQLAGGRGKTVRFRTTDVLKLRTEMVRQGEQAELQRREGREALTATKRDRISVAVVGELVAHLEQQRGEQIQFGERLVESLGQHLAMSERLGEKLVAEIARHDPRPVWLTREQALELSGLPASLLQQGIKDERLHPIGKGRGWRLNRDELLAFSVGLRK